MNVDALTGKIPAKSHAAGLVEMTSDAELAASVATAASVDEFVANNEMSVMYVEGVEGFGNSAWKLLWDYYFS